MEIDEAFDVGRVLYIALREVKEAWSTRDKRQDAVRRYSCANIWHDVTAAYSGLEQSLKVLAAHDLGMSWKEAMEQRWFRKHNHRMHDCWEDLSERTRRGIEEDWAQFRGLAGNPDEDWMQTAGAFLEHISSDRGYERWRYSLIEKVDAPVVHVEGMLQLWETTSRLYERKTLQRRGRRNAGPLERIEGMAKDVWETALCMPPGPPPKGVEAEIRRWLAAEGCANRTGELLWRDERGLGPDTRTLGTAAAEAVQRMARDVIDMWKVAGVTRKPEGKDSGTLSLAMFREPRLRMWRWAATHEGAKIVGLGNGRPRLRRGAERGTRMARARFRSTRPRGTTQPTNRRSGWNTLGEVRNRLYRKGLDVTEHEVPEDAARPGYYLLLEGMENRRTEGRATIRIWVRAEPAQLWRPEVTAEIAGDNAKTRGLYEGIVGWLKASR